MPSGSVSLGVLEWLDAIGAPAKRRRIGPKVAQTTGSSASSLANLARLCQVRRTCSSPPPPP